MQPIKPMVTGLIWLIERCAMGGGPGTVPARPMASPVQILSQGNPSPAGGSRTRTAGKLDKVLLNLDHRGNHPPLLATGQYGLINCCALIGQDVPDTAQLLDREG